MHVVRHDAIESSADGDRLSALFSEKAWKIGKLIVPLHRNNVFCIINIGNNVGTKETLITTNEGIRLVRRERTVKMPNGNLRHPVDYYDATPGAVEVTPVERERIRIPVYKMLI